MKIAIDVSPLQTGHNVRGVGFYLKNLKKSLLHNYPENQYQFFVRREEIDKNVELVHYPYFDPFSLTLPFKKQYKTVVTVHDLTPLVFPRHFSVGLKGNIGWQIQRFNLQRVDAILADSIASKKDIINLIKIADQKVTVAYLAAGAEFRQFTSEERKNKNLQEKSHALNMP